MSQFTYEQNRTTLDRLMTEANIESIEHLSNIADVSELQIRRLQYGLIQKLSIETVTKLSVALQLSLDKLITYFTETRESEEDRPSISSPQKSPQVWQQEYQQLENQLQQQAATLENEFQQESIQVIESWLIQWPTAIAAIAKNPDLPAERLIPLVKPVKELVEKWGLEPISAVGEELSYDPQVHELMNGSAEVGTMVKVRYVGYKQQDRILYKAKVSPVTE